METRTSKSKQEAIDSFTPEPKTPEYLKWPETLESPNFNQTTSISEKPGLALCTMDISFMKFKYRQTWSAFKLQFRRSFFPHILIVWTGDSRIDMAMAQIMSLL